MKQKEEMRLRTKGDGDESKKIAIDCDSTQFAHVWNHLHSRIKRKAADEQTSERIKKIKVLAFFIR